jgi:hypothetical protein
MSKTASNIVLGADTNGIRPIIMSYIPVSNVWMSIAFQAETNVTTSAWLAITNEVGAKVRLWTTNGAELPLTNSSALNVWKLPVQTTVSAYMQGIPRDRRARAWLTPPQPTVGRNYEGYEFMLESMFGHRLTNDVVIELRPLIYQVSTNSQSMRLVEFPAVQFRLTPNGDIEKIK